MADAADLGNPDAPARTHAVAQKHCPTPLLDRFRFTLPLPLNSLLRCRSIKRRPIRMVPGTAPKQHSRQRPARHLMNLRRVNTGDKFGSMLAQLVRACVGRSCATAVANID